jgi:hypothetical protein
MKKWMAAWFVMAAIVGLIVGLTCPVSAGPIEMQPAAGMEAAIFQATHVLEISYDHASFQRMATSNTTWATTNALPANSYARLTMMKLVTPIDGANTESALLYSGTAGDTNVFLEATEIAADGTEVYFKTTQFEFENGASGLATTNWVTNIITTAYGYQYFSTATNIITKIAQNSLCAMKSNTAGRVKLYFQIYTP